MTFKKLKKCWKIEVLEIVLALAVSLIAYFNFTHFNPGIEEMFSVIIFILVLIILKIPNKK